MSVALHQLKSAITRILYEKKRIDLVVNNAGYALVGPFEDSSMDEIKAQVEPILNNINSLTIFPKQIFGYV